MNPAEVVLSVELHTGKKKMQEFLILGSQPLTDLRDALFCVTDGLADMHCMKVPSGYFLIENVFYNDMRHGEAVDYSEPLLKFLELRKTRRKKSGERQRFLSRKMEETTFMDVSFRLGVKYTYCHQGECRHSLVFRDVRMIHPEDCQDPGAYPILKFIPHLKRKKCGICGVFRARKVTFEDPAVPNSPFFFCVKCFELLHSAEDEFEFRVQDYHYD